MDGGVAKELVVCAGVACSFSTCRVGGFLSAAGPVNNLFCVHFCLHYVVFKKFSVGRVSLFFIVF